MVKVPRTESLIQLTERLNLDNRFHIHKDFLKYLKMSELIRLCLVSSHYNKKYLNYCYKYFFASSSPILQDIKNNKLLYPYPEEAILCTEESPLLNKLLYYPQLRQCPKIMNSYNDYCELKRLYIKNKKITKLVNRYFAIRSV